MNVTNISTNPVEIDFLNNVGAEIRYVKTIMLINGFAAIISSAMSGFVILKFSTPRIGTYRIYLLNIAFWAACLDIFLSTYIPYMSFPLLTVCSFGLLQYFGDYHSVTSY